MRSDVVFPAGLRVSGLACLVVGHGPDAEARAQSLTALGAVVRTVQAFEETDLDGIWLAVLTDMDAALAARLFRATTQRRIFFCAVDQPEFCTFSHLALARAGDLTLAISTNGRAPALSRRIREELERLFAESNLAAFVARLAALRDATPPEKRREVLSPIVKRLRFTGKLEVPGD